MNFVKTGIKVCLVSLLLIQSLFQMGCSPKKEILPVSKDSITVPYQEFGKTELFSYAGSFKRWELHSNFMRKPLLDTGTMLVVPVRLTLYDSLGKKSSLVLADSGTTDKTMEKFTLWGNVYIRTQDSMVIKSQLLWWNKESKKVESNTYVQIETPKGDVLRGKGLDANESFSRFTFKADVKGRFPDFKNRVEANEDNIF